MKIINHARPLVPVTNMEDGQIAIIRVWPSFPQDEGSNLPKYEGRIVQRYLQRLITLGADSETSFPSLFEIPPERLKNHLVEILPAGTQIEIE